MKKENLKDLFIHPDSPVVKQLIKKRDLLRAGDERHKEIRPLLIAPGGGMRGIFGAAQVTALNYLDLYDVFDVVVGISAGAPTAAYFLGGLEQTRRGASIFYQQLNDNKFIDFKRFPHMQNMETFRNAFEVSDNKLDIQAVLNSRTDLFIASTDEIDGNLDVFKLKEHPEKVMDILLASSAMPMLADGMFRIDDRRYIDGSVSFSMRRFLNSNYIKEMNPTDIILLTNSITDEDKNTRTFKIKNFFYSVFPRSLERLLFVGIRVNDDLQYLHTRASNGNFNVGIFNLPKSHKKLSSLSTSAQQLRQAGNESLKLALASLGYKGLYKDLP